MLLLFVLVPTCDVIEYIVSVDFTPSVFYLDGALPETASTTPSRSGIWGADREVDVAL